MTATILVVEDNPASRELLMEILEGAGFVVLGSGSAEQGLTLARALHPDLVLLDIGLPGMNGLDAIRALRADPATHGIVAAAVTAYAMAGDEERARAAGFDAYVSKPIDAERLLAAVRLLLCRREPS